MKKLLLLIIILSYLSINAQFYENWTEPFPITDSLSINTNPDVLVDTDILNGDVVVFYEKKMSAEANKQIWMRNLTTLEDEQEILSAENTDFRNPKLLIFSPYYNTRCFIIYESNETGNYNIYGIEFFENGSFGFSFQLTHTPEDENSNFVSSGYDELTACWEANNNIYFSEISFSQDTLQFDEVVTIDTNFCHEPICSDDHVFYRRMVGDSAHIYFSKNIAIGVWTMPSALYALGNNTNLKMIEQMFFGGLDEEYIIWENNGQTMAWSYWSQEVTYFQFQDIDITYEPSCLIYDLITDFWLPSIFTFCSGENENREVYAVNEEFTNIVVNISNNNYIDSYPTLFMGRMYGNYFNTLNIWHSEVESGNVLFLSQKSILFGGTDEYESSNKLSLQVSPNPFKAYLEIEFESEETGIAIIEIIDLTGTTIFSKDFNVNNNISKSYILNSKQLLEKISGGIYFVKFTQGESTVVRKVVYSE